MGNLRYALFSLCLALVAFSLASHFIVDAACGATEADVLPQCSNSAGASELVANPLHTGVVTPVVFSLATPLALGTALVVVGFHKLSRFVAPPVQPPKTSPIA